jgi:ribose 5-phosphate isomerase B
MIPGAIPQIRAGDLKDSVGVLFPGRVQDGFGPHGEDLGSRLFSWALGWHKLALMIDEATIRTIARRAAGRVASPSSGPTEMPAEVTVLEAPRPVSGAAETPKRLEPPLITEACLKDVPDGGIFTVSPRAQFTLAAEEEAHRRGIRFSEGVPAAGGGLRRTRGTARVAVSSDHGGFALKGSILESLRELGHFGMDLGPADNRPCDWPERAHEVAEAVAQGRADLGVVIDTVGIGSAMAANKVPGARAANCWDVAVARNAREHNHANVLVLGSRHLTASSAHDILAAFCSTEPGAGRHARRAGMLDEIEARHGAQTRTLR